MSREGFSCAVCGGLWSTAAYRNEHVWNAHPDQRSAVTRGVFQDAPRRWAYQAGKRARSDGLPHEPPASHADAWQWGWEDAADTAPKTLFELMGI